VTTSTTSPVVRATVTTTTPVVGIPVTCDVCGREGLVYLQSGWTTQVGRLDACSPGCVFVANRAMDRVYARDRRGAAKDGAP